MISIKYTKKNFFLSFYQFYHQRKKKTFYRYIFIDNVRFILRCYRWHSKNSFKLKSLFLLPQMKWAGKNNKTRIEHGIKKKEKKSLERQNDKILVLGAWCVVNFGLQNNISIRNYLNGILWSRISFLVWNMTMVRCGVNILFVLNEQNVFEQWIKQMGFGFFPLSLSLHREFIARHAFVS